MKTACLVQCVCSKCSLAQEMKRHDMDLGTHLVLSHALESACHTQQEAVMFWQLRIRENSADRLDANHALDSLVSTVQIKPLVIMIHQDGKVSDVPVRNRLGLNFGDWVNINYAVRGYHRLQVQVLRAQGVPHKQPHSLQDKKELSA
jgi:hypothetical protein